jgi:hypothetical protein
LLAFFDRLPDVALRAFAQNLLTKSPQEDAQSYFLLLRFLVGLGRPTDMAKDKADLSSVGPLEQALFCQAELYELFPLHLSAIAGNAGLTKCILKVAVDAGQL